MKRITFILVSLLTLLPLGGKADPGDVILVEINKEANPAEIPRSLTPEVECYYLISSALLEVQFNLNLGSAEVVVTDQANTLVGYGELTVTPGSLFVPVEAGSGIYSISIETSSGSSYTGQFIL